MKPNFGTAKNGYDMQNVDKYVDALRSNYLIMKSDYEAQKIEISALHEKIKQFEELEKQKSAIAQALIRAESFVEKAEKDVKDFNERKFAETKKIVDSTMASAESRAKQIIAEAESQALQIIEKTKSDVRQLTEQEAQHKSEMQAHFSKIESILKVFKEGGLTTNGEAGIPETSAQKP